ncbi:MAG TPA: RNA methyltransferase, partial [Flavobacteriales bacterium]|nr:RNA methyltransferase [Flavobacteriales bacterium]
AFMDWRGFDEDEWWSVRDALKEAREPIETKIFTSDRDFAAISQARQSLANMELVGRAELGRLDFFKLKPRSETGLLVLNPPYGER